MLPIKDTIKILFICIGNVARSRVAAELYNREYLVKSAGFQANKSGTIRVDTVLFEWANIVIVFERAHIDIIREEFPKQYICKRIINLNIPDNFEYDFPELRELIQSRLDPILENIEYLPDHIINAGQTVI